MRILTWFLLLLILSISPAWAQGETMKPFHIKFDGEKAIVTLLLLKEQGWMKKNLTARDGKELWQGLQALLDLDDLPEERKQEAVDYLAKAKEREALETAIPAWLSKGNKIKELPARGEKVTMQAELINEILAELGAA